MATRRRRCFGLSRSRSSSRAARSTSRLFPLRTGNSRPFWRAPERFVGFVTGDASLSRMKRILAWVALGALAGAACSESSTDFDDPSDGGTSGSSATGGSATGGTQSGFGGSATGGSATGGSSSGGTATGGASTGGSAAGGSESGGTATGGSATGGSATGGSATAGAGTGGSVTGGSTAGGAGGAAGSAGMGGRSLGGAGGAVVGDVCTLMADNCPDGYACACGGPGAGQCRCRKQCEHATDCGAVGFTCGCDATSVAPGLCVDACFCLCD